jgi:hypothetical protein
MANFGSFASVGESARRRTATNAGIIIGSYTLIGDEDVYQVYRTKLNTRCLLQAPR